MKVLALSQVKPLLGCSFPSHGRASAEDFAQISGASVDSRNVKPRDLFFALKGAKVDGHDFLSEAASKGASAAVVNANYAGPNYGLPLLHVSDPLDSLQTLAKTLLSQWKTRVVGVTGSSGKTTTKDFISTLLSSKYRVAASPGNHNSQIGLPLTILNHMQGDEDVLVLEMGMTAAGHIEKLVQIAPPEVAVVTMVDLSHACNFNSLEGIAAAKAEIFSHPSTSLGIILKEIEHYDRMTRVGKCRKLSFSVSTEDADLILKERREHLLIQERDGPKVLPRLPVPGRHNLQNFLAAAAAARALEVSWDEIAFAIPKLCLPERRLQPIQKEGVLFINDSYNASLASMRAAFQALPSPQPGGKRIAVLGEMFELGKFSEGCHREVGEMALECFDSLICMGEGCRPMYEIWSRAGRHVHLFHQVSEIVDALQGEMRAGDVVLLKGSNGKGLWRILEAIDLNIHERQP